MVSHPQATAQCRRFLRERLAGAERVVAPSTADAVLSVRDSSEPDVALGSRLAAELYGCRILVADVEDHPDNVTRFVWLAPAGERRQARVRRQDLARVLGRRRPVARLARATRCASSPTAA